MGTTGSTPTPTGPSAQYGTADPEFDKITSGVRITVAGESSSKVENNTDDKIMQAYNKGKEDGKASFQSSLEQVAAQVYDGVHARLTDIQTDGLSKSKILVRRIPCELFRTSSRHLCEMFNDEMYCIVQAEELQQKLTVPGSFGSTNGSKQMPCVAEQSVLLKCLKENAKANSLSCKDAVDAYSRCAMSP